MSEQNNTTPQGPENKAVTPVKQSAVTPQLLRIPGFRGAFLDARFGDDGVSEQPVSLETEKALKEQFPKAKVTAVEAKTDGKK